MNTHPDLSLSQAISQATATLQKFAQQSDFLEQLEVAFGDSFDRHIAIGIGSQLRSGDFSLVPEIQVLAGGELGTANGAFAASLDEIFVSSDFLAQNSNNVNAIAELLLEEIGHKLDRLLNGNVDSPGDEGAIFRLLATGQTLSPETLAGLRGTDDRAVITVNEESIAIEQQDFFGDAGDNTLIGTSGNDVFNPDTGADIIDGGGGIDRLVIQNFGDFEDTTITYTTPTTGKILGGSNNGTKFKNIESVSFITGSGNDLINISATTDSSVIEAGDGNDTVIAGAGNDFLYTGTGNDTVTGGAGDDLITAGTGNDTIDGGGGTDRLVIGNFSDGDDTTITYNSTTTGTIIGGSNNGTKFQNIESGTFYTGSGNDIIDISATTGNSTIEAGAGNDTVTGGVGDDLIFAGIGADTIDGGAGNDFLSISNTGNIDNTTITYINTSTGTITGGSNHGTKFKNIESVQIELGFGNDVINISAATRDSRIYAGEGNNTVTGGAGNDSITSFGNGNNIINGGNGNDSITTFDGNDTVNGGAGNDTITVGKGTDTINGGGGYDSLSIDNTTDTVDTTISYTTAATGNISGGSNHGTKFKNIESVTFRTGSGNDTIDISATTRNSLVNAGAGNNTVTGGAGNDGITTGVGNDTVSGGAGNDGIRVGEGNDTVTGGAGNDFIDAGNGNNTIDGGNGDDSISTDEGNDTVTGGAGNDFIDAGNGNNTIDGGNGDDSISTDEGNDTVTGGAGNDSIGAGNGNNTIDGGNGNDTIGTGNGNDTVNGGAGNDTIYISAGTDTIDGGAGYDSLSTIGFNSGDTEDTTITYTTPTVGSISGGSNKGTKFQNIESVTFYTGSGNDAIDISATTRDSLVNAGAGNNTVTGGKGNDNISVEGGNDTVTGGAGNDTIDVGTGSNTIDGGAGNDLLVINDINFIDIAEDTTITYTNSTAGTINGSSNNGTTFKNIESVTFYTGDGNDVINISATTGDSIINAGSGNDMVTGGTGNDRIDVGTGADTIDGGVGNDYLSIQNFGDTEDTTITYTNSTAGTISGGSNDGTKFQNIESGIFITGSGNDKIDISATTGDSTIEAGDGNDTVTSGAGNDIISIGTGSDKIDGGTGTDRLVIGFNNGDTANTAIYYTTALGRIGGGSNNGTKFQNIESVSFSTGSGNDLINISATTGDSTIEAGDGNNNVTGGAGNDNISGGTGNDTLNGGAGNDRINGGAGNDRINGGDGNDRINGGAGNNTLKGGNDDDLYAINPRFDIGTTIIYETTTGGVDTLDFFNIDPRTRSATPVNVDLSLTTIQTIAPNLQLVIPVVSLENVHGTIRGDILKGNSLNNTLIGNAGSDILTGGAGSDRFVFSGSNPFAFNNAITAQLGTDTITDFTTGEDKIVLAKNNFSAITNDVGTAIGANFAIVADDNTAFSSTISAAIIYSQSSGNLFYNTNGVATGLGRDGGNFATLAGIPTLTESDFAIVA